MITCDLKPHECFYGYPMTMNKFDKIQESRDFQNFHENQEISTTCVSIQ